MEELCDIPEQLKTLLEEYRFNVNTLSKYLAVPAEDICRLADGNLDVLPDDNILRFEIYNKISFLYLIPYEGADKKLSAFLMVLISYHGLSKDTIARMALVEKSDIDKILSGRMERISDEKKYRVAAAVMCLRFFLKENEPG
ncbi:HTH domain-containing protein [Qiania dongpingensis]|uniref:Uncharacterized protein n=1 Tax=Qiania dongpingensis TaxID=2763669 RepID=A0A7G9G6D4_9FIRM|nr:HTH domain-containing protein [Qiania dongpingensis]QNM06366.1 hypothetical protein H9Q78_04305 [Qiania dongpingensis]